MQRLNFTATAIIATAILGLSHAQASQTEGGCLEQHGGFTWNVCDTAVGEPSRKTRAVPRSRATEPGPGERTRRVPGFSFDGSNGSQGNRPPGRFAPQDEGNHPGDRFDAGGEGGDNR